MRVFLRDLGDESSLSKVDVTDRYDPHRHIASAAATARYYEFKKRRAEALEEDTRDRLRRV